MSKLKPFAPVVLRIGISLVFLWFGTSQIISATAWTAYVPDYVTSLSGLSAATIVHMNGLFEIVFGSLLLFGLFTRVTAILLALHMLDITFTVGLDATGWRDLGLSIATFSIFLYGRDWFSLDRFRMGGIARTGYAARPDDAR